MRGHLARVVQGYPLTAGLLLMFALTWPIDLGVAADSRGWLPFQIPFVVPLLVGYGFVVASLVVTAIVDGKAGIRALLRRFLIWRVELRWYVAVLLGPIALALAALAAPLVLHGVAPDFNQTMAREISGPLSLWLFVPIFFLMGVLTNGEEIGWRGYLLPRIQTRFGALAASVLIGVIWAAWHIPKFLGAGAILPVPAWLYLLDKIALAILFTWVANHTRGSLLIATLFHAAVNTAFVWLVPTTGQYDSYESILRCMVALMIVLATGPNLTRKPGRQPALQAVPASKG